MYRNDKNNKAVMCVGTYPEDNYTDFIVFYLGKDESDNDGINRAKLAYGNDNEYYIKVAKDV